jgi:hypothetical protein
MPQGYYAIEKWMQPKNGAAHEWAEVLQLPSGTSLTDAENVVKKLGPGLFRLLQIQRVMWVEQDGDGVRLRKSHALSQRGLDGIQEMFERTGGRYPVEEVRNARRLAKKARNKKPKPRRK